MDAKKIGQRLREKRGNRTLMEVCQATGIKQPALSMYETGRRIPGDEAKKKLAQYYNTTIDRLFFSP